MDALIRYGLHPVERALLAYWNLPGLSWLLLVGHVIFHALVAMLIPISWRWLNKYSAYPTFAFWLGFVTFCLFLYARVAVRTLTALLWERNRTLDEGIHKRDVGWELWMTVLPICSGIGLVAGFLRLTVHHPRAVIPCVGLMTLALAYWLS